MQSVINSHSSPKKRKVGHKARPKLASYVNTINTQDVIGFSIVVHSSSLAHVMAQ
eukprot:m.58228 g.58228  ORF g.58228 m.58228 type:complete len:55 (+) comp13756_c1_seq4:429-593(+)